ncbi:lysine-specific demethylase 4D-like [Frankliniella occidentalis]|uniref:Lysine-specific demethylase 4D-like n=1 Tax=Frankliniella occidentalis TaxID=133901 RepID=A0A9C6X831_FRAOC|nr:lysine-specific demethylase 4D-like [Frankliniella occidentalis]XP_052130839.1 lysine-specific demethylase 4D-like [Frankliniella occidentalis]
MRENCNHVCPRSSSDGNYPGINSSYMYFGLKHSFFPIHIEDLSMYSINFLHRRGFPKIWVVVPPTSISKLHHFLSREFAGPAQHRTCIGLLSHKYFVPTPAWLRRNGIPFKVVVQRNGEGVLVAPNAAHFGFNTGNNCAEATNFASKAYLPYGIVYPKCTCMPGEVHADLTVVIKSQSPELLEAYKAGKVPVVSSPNF